MKEKVAVIIPYYHSDLTETEKISFDNCCNVLKNYPIILIVPEGMDREEYPNDKRLFFKKVPDSWLESIKSYNHMMLSKEFYQFFFEYEYILIFQLDAFVFRDELSEFCSFDYDYIGAPWLYGAFVFLCSKRCVWYVGNGGLSLRRVKSCYNLLERNQDFLNQNELNEDAFFASVMSDDFKIAPIDVALKFAFERNIEKCFIRNNYELPFGCHAWSRYNVKFLKKYIEQMGYEISDNIEKSGNGDELLIDRYVEMEKEAYYWRYIYTSEHLRVVLRKLLKSKMNNYVIWGAGIKGIELSNMLKEAGIYIDYFCDKNPDLFKKKRNGFAVYSPQHLSHEKTRVNVIVTIKKKSLELIKQLEEQGFKYGYNCTRYEDVLSELFVYGDSC